MTGVDKEDLEEVRITDGSDKFERYTTLCRNELTLSRQLSSWQFPGQRFGREL